jgi:hypothetical protein
MFAQLIKLAARRQCRMRRQMFLREMGSRIMTTAMMAKDFGQRSGA